MDSKLSLYRRYIGESRPSRPVHNHYAKVLMKIADLRSLATRHLEPVIEQIKVGDASNQPPPFFFELFEETRLQNDDNK